MHQQPPPPPQNIHLKRSSTQLAAAAPPDRPCSPATQPRANMAGPERGAGRDIVGASSALFASLFEGL